MTFFLITDSLRKLIENSDLEKDEKKTLIEQGVISNADLKSFYLRCKPTSSMRELLKSTRLHLENRNSKNADTPKTKEFLESMERLRLQAAEDEYQLLLKRGEEPNFIAGPSRKLDEDDLSPAKMQKEIKSHITTIFNVLVSVGSVVYAIWYWTETSWKINDAYRVLLCLFFGLLILVAEVVVYLGYLNKIDDARAKERSKVEVKKVIRTTTL